MKKSFKKSNGLGTQTVFSNTVEYKPKQVKEFYGIIETKEGSKVVEYETKFRSVAVAYFEEQARLIGGHLSTVSVYK